MKEEMFRSELERIAGELRKLAELSDSVDLSKKYTSLSARHHIEFLARQLHDLGAAVIMQPSESNESVSEAESIVVRDRSLP